MIPRSFYTILQPDGSDGPHRPVLWHNPPLLALYKPSGVLVHNSAYAGPKERTLLDQVETQSQQRVYPLHRIDRGTSGLVLASHTREGIAEWMDALHSPATVREYIVILRGTLDHVVRVERPIPNKHGKDLPSKTIFAPMRQNPSARLTLARARIFTGRTHQIRRHARSMRQPVLGDSTWGDNKFNRRIRAAHGVDRLMLHAWRIQMTGPNGTEYDLVSIPDLGFQNICRELFDFDGWAAFGGMSTLQDDAAYVVRDKGGKAEAVG